MATSRRNFVKNAGASIGVLTMPNIVHGATLEKQAIKKFVCLGGHPDDPESGCGGTLAKLRNAGHAVTVIYLTTGEAGIPGTPLDKAAVIRKNEAIQACKILDVKYIFAGQVDGNSILNNEWVEKITQLIANEAPDVLFTHWPLDAHKDHQVASLLGIQSWTRLDKKFDLYFFEVCTGMQTYIFHPTDYVDITATQTQKKAALYCHLSQNPPEIYACGHAAMEDFRGREMGVKAAEAFVKMNGKLF